MATIDDTNKIINDLIEQKRLEDPKYSLRMFAKEVNIQQSNLSKILKGQRRFTAFHIEKISKRFQLSAEIKLQLFESISI